MGEHGSREAGSFDFWALRLFFPIVFALFSLDAVFIEFGTRHRQVVFDGVSKALLSGRPETLDEIRMLLQEWTPKERYYSVTPPDPGTAGTSFVFSKVSKLHLWVQYQPGTGAIDKYELVYFVSVPVDLETGEGLPRLFNSAWWHFAWIGCVAAAAFWYFRYPKWGEMSNIAWAILYLLAAGFLFVFLGIATLNLAPIWP